LLVHTIWLFENSVKSPCHVSKAPQRPNSLHEVDFLVVDQIVFVKLQHMLESLVSPDSLLQIVFFNAELEVPDVENI
jgi:hypothetical protein